MTLEQNRCNVGHFRGVEELESNHLRGIQANISCSQWSCDQCRPKLIKKLRRRIFQGNFSSHITKDSKFAVKFLTLTLPGKAFRSQYTQEEAYVLMSANFRKLVKALKKSSGEFHYLRVVEPQRDGYPHLHVVLAGDAVAPRNILGKIRNLWSYKYQMGNIDLKYVRNFKHAIRYITKYLSKNSAIFKRKGKKYTASKGLLMKKEKKTWLDKKILSWCGPL